MASIVVNGITYNLNSRSSGEYSGPCPFGRGGDDRAAIWPQKNYRYYCRKECPDCPGHDAKRVSKGGTTGLIHDVQVSGKVVTPRAVPVPSLEDAVGFHKELKSKTVDYLGTRKIKRPTIDRFLIGTNCRRFTIPNITKNGKPTCHGIKNQERLLELLPDRRVLDRCPDVGAVGYTVHSTIRWVQDLASGMEPVLQSRGYPDPRR